MTPKKRRPVFYGWVIVAAGVVVWTLEPGMYASFGVFFKPIAADMGWSRAAVSAAVSLASLAVGVLAPMSGALADRYGSRRLVITSGLVVGAGYALLSTTASLWQFYLYYLMVGIGMGVAFAPILATVLRWFEDRRGLALGITSVGTGLGGMLLPPLSTQLISLWGWQRSYLVLGVALGVLVVAAGSLLRKDPREMGLEPYRLPSSQNGRRQSPSDSPSTPAVPLRQAVRSFAYWRVFFATTAAVFCFILVQVHLIPYATDLGISPVLAATVMTVLGAGNSLGRVGLGALSDRLGSKLTLLATLALMALAMLWLPFSRSLWGLYAFALVFGVAYGGAHVGWTRLPGELFGLASVGALIGLLHTGSSLGGAAGSYSAGYVFDLTGSYGGAFLVAALLLLIAGLLVLLLRPPRIASSGAAPPPLPS